MDNATGNASPVDLTGSNGCIWSGDSQPGAHRRRGRVADDPVRQRGLGSAKVQFPFPGGVFGDIGDPHLVHPASSTDEIGGESRRDRQHEHRDHHGPPGRDASRSSPASCHRKTTQLMSRTQPPGSALTHHYPSCFSLITQIPVGPCGSSASAARTAATRPCTHPVRCGDRAEPTTGNTGPGTAFNTRHVNVTGRQLFHEREVPSSRWICLRQLRCRPPQHPVFLLQQPVPTPQNHVIPVTLSGTHPFCSPDSMRS